MGSIVGCLAGFCHCHVRTTNAHTYVHMAILCLKVEQTSSVFMQYALLILCPCDFLIMSLCILAYQ